MLPNLSPTPGKRSHACTRITRSQRMTIADTTPSEGLADTSRQQFPVRDEISTATLRSEYLPYCQAFSLMTLVPCGGLGSSPGQPLASSRCFVGFANHAKSGQYAYRNLRKSYRIVHTTVGALERSSGLVRAHSRLWKEPGASPVLAYRTSI